VRIRASEPGKTGLDTRPDTHAASPVAFGNVTDVRIGHHDGFDRVVLDFGGRGTPG
jgi:hypothetical protein